MRGAGEVRVCPRFIFHRLPARIFYGAKTRRGCLSNVDGEQRTYKRFGLHSGVRVFFLLVGSFSQDGDAVGVYVPFRIPRSFHVFTLGFLRS